MKNDSLFDAIALVFLSVLAVTILAAKVAFADPVTAISNVTSIINGWTAASAAIAIVLEAVFRLLPTATPLSWAWIFANTLQALSSLFAAAAKWLDSVLPQQTK